jgi:hypothetical protein
MMAYTQIRFLVIAAALVIIIVGINQAQSVLPSFLDNPKITDKIKKVLFTQPSLSREDEGRGANNFTGQEGNSCSGHWRHRIYRDPFDRSAYSKRNASPLPPSQNQRFEVAEESFHRIRSWRL